MESPPKTLFQVLTEELRLRNYSPKTIKAYKSCIRSFAVHFSPRHPRELTNEDVRAYLLHLLEKRKIAPSTVNQVFNALRFLYVELYKRPFVIGSLPRPKKPSKLPVTLSQQEVLRILNCIDNLKHKTILMLIYSAGLRVGEAVRLKIADIDSDRNLIHIEHAKGMKDRYTLLSEAMVPMLRDYCKKYRPVEFLFEGGYGRTHLAERSVQHVFERAVKDAGILKDVSVHSLRHSSREIDYREKSHEPILLRLRAAFRKGHELLHWLQFRSSFEAKPA